MYPVASHNPTADWGFLPSAPGQRREEHAQGDDPDAPRGGHLQAPGAAVLCAGNDDGLGLQRLQVCTFPAEKAVGCTLIPVLKKEDVWHKGEACFISIEGH